MLAAAPLGNHAVLRALPRARSIKNARTQTAQAAAAIKAERRWAVTGTPIQNSLQASERARGRSLSSSSLPSHTA